MRRLVVTQSLVKYHQLILMWKILIIIIIIIIITYLVCTVISIRIFLPNTHTFQTDIFDGMLMNFSSPSVS